MWTEEYRRTHRREGDGYPSDLRDVEWAQLEPLIPPVRPGGRPRKTDMRAAMNAIPYLRRTGCPWRRQQNSHVGWVFGFERSLLRWGCAFLAGPACYFTSAHVSVPTSLTATS